MKPKLLISLGVIVILFLATALAVNAAGLGVAPSELKFENALKGATSEKQFTIFNPGDAEIQCTITSEGVLSEWLSFSSLKVTIPANSNKKITAKLTPPANKPNGKYEAIIHVKSEASSTVAGTGMGILPAVAIKAVATITDKEIIDGECYKILTRDVEYGKPVIFLIGFSNMGNIATAPDVEIDIIKGEVIDTIKKTLQNAKPGENKDYEVRWQTYGKQAGAYQAKVTVKLKGKTLEQKTVNFNVIGEGAKTQPKTTPKQSDYVTGLTTKSKITLSENLIGIIIIIAIVAMGAIAYYVIKKRK